MGNKTSAAHRNGDRPDEEKKFLNTDASPNGPRQVLNTENATRLLNQEVSLLYERNAGGPAVPESDVDLIQRLVKDQADPNVRNVDGRTLVSLAAEMCGGCLGALLASPLMHNPDVPDLKGITPLMYAAGHDFQNTQRLLEAKANPELKDAGGSPALFYAAASGLPKTVRLLLRQPGVDAYTLNCNGDTPLLFAAEHLEVMRCLLKADADPNAFNRQGTSPLIAAVKHGSVEGVRLLLAQPRIKLDIQTDTGHTPLMFAVCFDNLDKARLLVKAKASPDVRDNRGQTALIWAAGTGRIESVELLLRSFPTMDIRLQDWQGVSALEWARRGKHFDVVSRLLAAGAE